MINRTKILLGVLVGVVALATALPSGVSAKGTPNVAAGLHNLSASGTDPYFGAPSQYAMDEPEVCVFCHTPHGGSLTGPLWNRNNPASASFTHYSSATLGTYLAGLGNSRALSDESLMCMSCHDGSIFVQHVINLPNTRTTPIEDAGGNPDTDIGLAFVVGARIGGAPGGNEMATGNLTDDHPISFSYDDILLSADYVGIGAKVGQLHPVATAENGGAGVRFFNKPMAGLGGNRVECSTCHDPHVEYGDYGSLTLEYAPFLIMSNAGSNLCLACHNK